MTIKSGDKVQLAGTKTTGAVESIDGETATVKWDDEAAGLSKKVSVTSLEAAKKKRGS